jgi:hypothetical protein
VSPRPTGIRTIYLVERYLPGLDAAALERLQAALDDVRLPVAWLGSLALPGDEVSFCVFAAASREQVEHANEVAGLAYERVVEALLLASRRNCRAFFDPEPAPATQTRERPTMRPG